MFILDQQNSELCVQISGDLSKLKEKVFTIKEGGKYRMKVSFYIQREIVSGLRYEQKTSRKGIQGKRCEISYNEVKTMVKGKYTEHSITKRWILK